MLSQVGTVAADVCCKMVETRTSSAQPNAPEDSIWRDTCRSVGQQYGRFDSLDAGRPITTSGVEATDSIGLCPAAPSSPIL